MANILQYPRDFLVWVDETGTDRRDQLRQFGYSVRGFPAVSNHLLTRVSAIVAMSSDGVEAYELYQLGLLIRSNFSILSEEVCFQP